MPRSHPHLMTSGHIYFKDSVSISSPAGWLMWQKSPGLEWDNIFTPQWMNPGITFACWLVTCRVVSTQLLLLGELKIRCNCTDKSGDYTTPCLSKSRSQSVYLCLCVAVMKNSVPISVSEIHISQTWLQLLKWVESNTAPLLCWSLQLNCILLTNISVVLPCSDF